MNYEQDIRIDETALDVEWLEQPTLMMKYAKIAAEARRELDLAKENLDVIKAEIDKDIRMNPENYDLGKVTEAAIFATMLGTAKYKKANQRLIDAKYEADVASAAVRAMDARKEALENLVRLHGQQYFAGPRMPRDLKWEREQKQKDVNKLTASGIKRTK